MSSFSAKFDLTTNSELKRIVFVAYPGVKLLDLTGPLQVFSDAVADVDHENPAYQVCVASLSGGEVETDTTVPIATVSMKEVSEKPIHALVVAGGRGFDAASRNQEFLKQLESLYSNSLQIASVCSGAFILAATGILDKCRAVTHWQSCNDLARRFPQVKVETDPIFIRDGNVWTSAGVTAGIDLALAMVAEDLGRSAALALARRLVAYMVRPGGQSQFSDMLHLQSKASEGRFKPLVEWISSNLCDDLCVENLAEKANMSARNFARIFSKEMGKTPAKYIETMRLDRARLLLEETALPIITIAERCGFDDDERMRRAFVRNLHVSPNEYRQRF